MPCGSRKMKMTMKATRKRPSGAKTSKKSGKKMAMKKGRK